MVLVSICQCVLVDAGSTKDLIDAVGVFRWKWELPEVVLMTELSQWCWRSICSSRSQHRVWACLGEGEEGINRFTVEWNTHTLTEQSRKRGREAGEECEERDCRLKLSNSLIQNEGKKGRARQSKTNRYIQPDARTLWGRESVSDVFQSTLPPPLRHTDMHQLSSACSPM